MNDDRSTYIGGPEVAVLMGSSTWATTLEIWKRKTGNAVELPPEHDPDFLNWGRILEPVILREFARRECMSTAPGGFRRDAAEPWRAGHADSIAWRDGERGFGQIALEPEDAGRRIVEVKNLSRPLLNQWDRKGVPPDYQHQVQHYLDLYGLKLATFPVLFGGQLLCTYHVKADPVEQAKIRDVCRRFWTEHVLPKIPPEENPEGPVMGVSLHAMDEAVLQDVVALRESTKGDEGALEEAIEYLRSISEANNQQPLVLNDVVIADWTDVAPVEYVVKNPGRRQFNVRQVSVLRRALGMPKVSRKKKA